MRKKIPLLTIILFLEVFAGQSYAQVIRKLDTSFIKPRVRVIVDNDFGGDPDGLFMLTHILLSPSADVRAVIGSHLRAGDWFDPSRNQANNAATKASEIINMLNLQDKIPVVAGSNTGMVADSVPVKSAAVDFIIREAMRTDTKTPLYVLCGAGLTEIASALLTRPEIANKLTLIWIGGPEYEDLALPPPHVSNPEYNLNIDINAAKVVFNKSAVQFWQIPRNAYRQAIIPYSQLLLDIKSKGRIGEYLVRQLENLMRKMQENAPGLGETYILGDSPLVLLTALQSSFEPDPSSSIYVFKKAPLIKDDGNYTTNREGRTIRVYTVLDVRLMFNDFVAKLELFTNQY